MPDASKLAVFARAELGTMLDALLDSPAALRDVAQRSYEHDNGFLKIVLHRGGGGGRPALRLHVWPAGHGDGGNVHNHCWNFTSVVLAGELRFEEFAADAGGEVPARHFAYVPTAEFEYELRLVEDTALRRTGAGVRRPGETYLMSAEVLHRTWGSQAERTITLLTQGERRRAHADVYVTGGSSPTRQMQNEPLASARLADALREVRALLPASS